MPASSCSQGEKLHNCFVLDTVLGSWYPFSPLILPSIVVDMIVPISQIWKEDPQGESGVYSRLHSQQVMESELKSSLCFLKTHALFLYCLDYTVLANLRHQPNGKGVGENDTIGQQSYWIIKGLNNYYTRKDCLFIFGYWGIFCTF